MNILTDELPESVEFSGISVSVRADHRSCIRAIIALLDEKETEYTDASFKSLNIFYIDNMWMRFPEEALKAETKFLRGIPVPVLPGQKAGGGSNTSVRAYSFLYDQAMLFAAFWQQYGIDLTKQTLHWWAFKALLDNLSNNNMAEIINLRTTQESSKMTKEQRETLKKEKRFWQLPNLAQDSRQADVIAQALISGDVKMLEAALGRN